MVRSDNNKQQQLVGAVCWITGLSGSGKTTLAHSVYKHLRKKKPNVVLLDGDATREVFGTTGDYSLEGRQAAAMRNARLCKLIASQGVDVICSTISMWNCCRLWNRENLTRYIEVYLRVPLSVLKERDSKGIYRNIMNQQDTNIVGVDLPAEEPCTPDLVIDNYGDTTPKEALEQVVKLLTSIKV